MLVIVTFPDVTLTMPCAPVRLPDPFLDQMIGPMMELATRAGGYGVTANQVGVNARFFVLRDCPDLHAGLQADVQLPPVWINPEIVSMSGTKYGPEGCLSIPNLNGDRSARSHSRKSRDHLVYNLTRAEHVVVKFWSLDGVEHVISCSGLLARVVQHEIDHLDGILFTDRLNVMEKAKADRDMAKLRRRADKGAVA